MSRIHQTSDYTASPNFNLPIDLIIEILSLLSVKTLHRIKSVCKTWCSLIESPIFVNKHLIRSNTMNFTSLLVTDWKIKSMWLQYLDKTENHNLHRNYTFETCPFIVGICDGLVCTILANNFDSFICNPSTGLIRKTSLSSLPKISSNNVFFGFALKDNDYKLFRVVYFISDSKVFVRAEVYSMSTDIWTEVSVKEVIGTLHQKENDVYFISSLPVAKNEVFYWKSFDLNVPSLVSFDTNGYIFAVILCPKEFIRDDVLIWQLVDFKGEIALISFRHDKCFDVWVLNEKERSWTMKLRIKELPWLNCDLRSLGFEKNDKLVMQNYYGIKLFSYDMESHEVIYLPFVGIELWQVVYLYTESLLSV